MKKVISRAAGLLILVLIAIPISYQLFELKEPEITLEQANLLPIVNEVNGLRVSEKSWYRKNNFGLWESFITGGDYERGRTFAALAKQQITDQEVHFISQIKKLIPSEWFLKTLKFGVAGFNRNIDKHVIPEYQRELLGVSRVFADEYDFIGPKYSRVMNYHAAHDIGHALQDLSIVGCSSFALWGNQTSSGNLLIARNFDFYMGDDFAKDKLILFNRPENGIPYASITWAGFMGVVSGMNLQGLTVTLNAAKSSIPTGAKTPISLLAREILQYASNIEQAIEIAEKRETFVSESILVGSANDWRAVVIEKSPEALDVFDPQNGKLICTNHYQSNLFKNDKINLTNIKNSDSKYRFDRLQQLIGTNDSLNVSEAIDILRNQKGLDNAELGMGNPKAINQLLAHHGIVFLPKEKKLWISTSPFQLGEFLCYKLDDIFAMDAPPQSSIYIDSLAVAQDSFVTSTAYQDFLVFKSMKNELFNSYALGRQIEWAADEDKVFIATNPESYVTYMALGDYYAALGNCVKAVEYYKISLTKEVASLDERKKLESSILECDE